MVGGAETGEEEGFRASVLMLSSGASHWVYLANLPKVSVGIAPGTCENLLFHVTLCVGIALIFFRWTSINCQRNDQTYGRFE